MCIFAHFLPIIPSFQSTNEFLFLCRHFIFSINLICYISLVTNNCQSLSFLPPYFYIKIILMKLLLHCHFVLVFVSCQMSLQLLLLLHLSSPILPCLQLFFFILNMESFIFLLSNMFFYFALEIFNNRYTSYLQNFNSS